MKPFMQIFLKPFAELSIGQLSANAQCLYLRLFMINNRVGWDKETFQAVAQRLQIETGIYSRNTLDRARKELIEAGFIEYIPGKNKQPSTYRLIPLSSEYLQNPDSTCSKIEHKTERETGHKTERETGRIIERENSTCSKIEHKTEHKTERETERETGRIIDKDIHNDKDPKTAAAAVRGCKGEGNLSNGEENHQEQSNATPYDPIVKLYSDNIHKLNPLQHKRLCNLVDKYGAEWTYAAVEEAAIKDGHTLGYVESILARWKRDGFKSSRSQAQSPQQAQSMQNSQVIPLLARRLPPLSAQRKMSCIDELAAMARGEIQ